MPPGKINKRSATLITDPRVPTLSSQCSLWMTPFQKDEEKMRCKIFQGKSLIQKRRSDQRIGASVS